MKREMDSCLMISSNESAWTGSDANKITRRFTTMGMMLVAARKMPVRTNPTVRISRGVRGTGAASPESGSNGAAILGAVFQSTSAMPAVAADKKISENMNRSPTVARILSPSVSASANGSIAS
ncbi:MAG TPA: hypothetical protein VGB64_01380, partial [Actinomycetota bacterium]